MECTHGQLCARFTDGLCSNHTNGLTDTDQMTTTQVATVTFGANTIACFTGNRRTDHHLINTYFIQYLDQVFIQQCATGDGHFIRIRPGGILGKHPSKYPVGQCFHDVSTFNQG